MPRIISGVSLFIASIIILVMCYIEFNFIRQMMITMSQDPQTWNDILTKHVSAIYGLQIAAAVAFAIVIFLRQVDGPVEFKALGFEFKGAAGQVIMWVICFLAITVAIKLCWSA